MPVPRSRSYNNIGMRNRRLSQSSQKAVGDCGARLDVPFGAIIGASGVGRTSAPRCNKHNFGYFSPPWLRGLCAAASSREKRKKACQFCGHQRGTNVSPAVSLLKKKEAAIGRAAACRLSEGRDQLYDYLLTRLGQRIRFRAALGPLARRRRKSSPWIVKLRQYVGE